jgi:transposase
VGIIGGLDVHRRQITFDYIDKGTGEVTTGRIMPATREAVRNWLHRFEAKEADFALEATTGGRFVVEELRCAGVHAHLAEPADTSALRGRKKRAKTDKADARHLRELNVQGRVPECWIPPDHILELRTQLRLYKALSDEAKAWKQRIQAQLFHQGIAPIENLSSSEGQSQLDQAALSPSGRQAVEIARRMIACIDEQAAPVYQSIVTFARTQEACKALDRRYGVGPITSAVLVSELGDARRFSSSRKAVRLAGLDITVHSSDTKRNPGRLSHQGPPILRWALYEAGKCASRRSSPDHAYYARVKERLGAKIAALSVGRKIVREACHTLKALGERGVAPPTPKKSAA